MSFVAKCLHCGHEQIADDFVAGSVVTCEACQKVFQARKNDQVIVVKLEPSGVSQWASRLGLFTLVMPFLAGLVMGVARVPGSTASIIFGIIGVIAFLTGIAAIICGIVGLCTAKPGTGSVNRSLVGILAPLFVVILGVIVSVVMSNM